jgi:ribosomal protein S9
MKIKLNYKFLKFMNSKQELIFQKDQIGIGKRKQSTARVFLIPGTGNIIN